MKKLLTTTAIVFISGCVAFGTPPKTPREQWLAEYNEWVDKYADEFDPRFPNAVPNIPIYIIPKEEQLYYQPENVARRKAIAVASAAAVAVLNEFTIKPAGAFLAGNPGNSGGKNAPQGQGAYSAQNGNAGAGRHGIDKNGNYNWSGELPPAHTGKFRRTKGKEFKDWQDAGKNGGGMNSASHRDDQQAGNNRSNKG